jgi:hypothetical protein
VASLKYTGQTDNRAVDSIPVALAATVIVIAIIVGLAAFGIGNATPAIQLASVDTQANAVANDCRYLLSLAPRYLDDPCSPQGAYRTMELDLPEGTEYLSLGFDPEADGKADGLIYYKVCGSKKAIIVDRLMKFKTASGDRMILRSGKYRISLEYARDALGQRYLLVTCLQ